jgi:hypothetical protein
VHSEKQAKALGKIMKKNQRVQSLASAKKKKKA